MNSSIDIVDSHIDAPACNIMAIYAQDSDYVMKGDSKISAVKGCGIAAEVGENNNFLIEGGIIDTPANEISSSNAKIIGGTIKGDTEFTGNVHISGNTIIEGDISLTTSSSIPASTMEITGGTVNGNIRTSSENSTVSISGGTFKTEPPKEYLAPGFSVETDDNGNFIVGGSTAKLATGSAVTAQGVDNTKATGFVTTISGVESISSICWAVTGNGATKSTEVFEVGNVGGEGDVKIGLIIDGLDDSAAVAKATVNGTINE